MVSSEGLSATYVLQFRNGVQREGAASLYYWGTTATTWPCRWRARRAVAFQEATATSRRWDIQGR